MKQQFKVHVRVQEAAIIFQGVYIKTFECFLHYMCTPAKAKTPDVRKISVAMIDKESLSP